MYFDERDIRQAINHPLSWTKNHLDYFKGTYNTLRLNYK